MHRGPFAELVCHAWLMQGKAAVDVDLEKFEAFKTARDATHDMRIKNVNGNRTEFTEWRNQVKADTEALIRERDDFANMSSMLKSIDTLPAEEEGEVGGGKKEGSKPGTPKDAAADPGTADVSS